MNNEDRTFYAVDKQTGEVEYFRGTLAVETFLGVLLPADPNIHVLKMTYGDEYTLVETTHRNKGPT